MTQAGAESPSTADGPRRDGRAVVAALTVGFMMFGGVGVLSAAGGPGGIPLSQAPATTTTTTTATTTAAPPAPPAADTLATDEMAMDSPAAAEPATTTTTGVQPPTAAGPTSTVTTAPRPARAPKPTTTTTALGTIESRGAAALAMIDYPWSRTGYSIVFAGPKDNLMGLTEPAPKRITVFVRPTQTAADIARVVGHEIAHAVDFTMTTDAERNAYRRIRGLDDRPWYPCAACSDYASPVGDWAETFAYWLLGDGSFNSQLAGRPTAAQLAALEPLFAPDAPAAPPTTTTTTAPPLLRIVVTLPPPPTTTTTTLRPTPTTPAYPFFWGGMFRRPSNPDRR